MSCATQTEARTAVGPHHAGAFVEDPAAATRLRAFVEAHKRLFVLTGAGCSTGSGIPDYRDEAGAWKGAQPIQHQAFVNSEYNRKRYWARSMSGWQPVARAVPNAAHRALARMQQRGRVAGLVTQNVDGLHSAAGSRGVVNLHGRLNRVLCLQCDARLTRRYVQFLLTEANPGWLREASAMRPDGDIELGDVAYHDFCVPDCPFCGGVLKPDVVFFGGSVPKPRVTRAWQRLAQADAVLVVGSSLTVWSGFRFVREAARQGLPVAAVNRGVTRGAELIDEKIDGDCAGLLAAAVD